MAAYLGGGEACQSTSSDIAGAIVIVASFDLCGFIAWLWLR